MNTAPPTPRHEARLGPRQAYAGGDRSASVNRAEYRAGQARQCLAALARAAQERRA